MKPFLPLMAALSGRRSLIFLLALVAPLSIAMSRAHGEVEARKTFERRSARIKVVAPQTAPAISQDSVDLALVMFGIPVPPNAEHPKLDRELRDRGLTARGAFMEKAQVTIGPSAFTSWGLLASTLAHELEVHCRQSFFLIYVMDLAGLDGTGEAERQAYVHELRNAKRFGLDRGDADLIADTMEYYYPLHVVGKAKGAGALAARVKTWLSTNALRNSAAF